jgi:hypothetical protein
MATLPSTTSGTHLGVEICCLWPIGAFHPGALRDWRDPEIYEAYPRAGFRVAARTLHEIKLLIAEAMHC